MGRSATTRTRAWLLPVAVWLAGALVFYRTVWSSGFRHLMGNDGDTRLIAYICEHWFALLHGKGSVRDLPFFFPVKGLLGWSDAFFLYQVLYAPLRELGCGPVLALQLTEILLSLVGFLGLYFLVRRSFRCAEWVALAGALVFTFANDLYLHAGSVQLAGVYLLPVILLAGLRAWDHVGEDRLRAGLWGAAAGGLYGLLFFTTYYVAVFSALAAVIGLFWTAVLSGRGAARFLDGARATWRWWLAPAGATVAAFGVALVPAALTYLPTRSAIGPVSRSTVLFYAVGWRGLADIGPGNLWSSIVRGHGVDLHSYEGSYALTPLLVAAFVAGAVWLALRRIRSRSDVPPGVGRAGPALALTALTLMLLPLKVGSRSPWLVLRHLPGFDAIRAVDRVTVVAGLAAVLALVAAAGEADRVLAVQRRISRRPPLALSVGLVVLVAAVVVEQFDTAPVTQIDRVAQDRLMASVRPAPPTCRYFYVVDGANPALPFFESQLDAMLVAQKVGVPTVDGYTGYNPKGWNLETIGDPTYAGSVLSWEAQEGLGPGACRLDLGTMTWSPG